MHITQKYQYKHAYIHEYVCSSLCTSLYVLTPNAGHYSLQSVSKCGTIPPNIETQNSETKP